MADQARCKHFDWSATSRCSYGSYVTERFWILRFAIPMYFRRGASNGYLAAAITLLKN